jgi:hypothetical protein
VIYGSKKFVQVEGFTHLGSIINEKSGSSEDVKGKIAKAQGLFSQLQKVWKSKK